MSSVDQSMELRGIINYGPPDCVNGYYLSNSNLEEHLNSFGSSWGRRPAHKIYRRYETVAKRLSYHFARRLSGRLNLSPEMLAQAWYLSIYTEFCCLIPIRHLARRIARLAGSLPVLIPLRLLSGRYLAFWESRFGEDTESGVSPFYLAAALKKAGADPIFLFEAPEVLSLEEKPNRVTFSFLPHQFWHSINPTFSKTRLGPQAFFPNHIRNPSKILSFLDDMLIVNSLYESLPESSRNHKAKYLPEVTVHFDRTTQAFSDNKIPVYCAKLPFSRLEDALLNVLGPITQERAKLAKEIVSFHGLKLVHICDCFSLESTILAHRCLENGGRICLWPHSTGWVMHQFWNSGMLSKIYCVNVSARKLWESRFPDVPCEIVSELMLKQVLEPIPLLKGAPLTIIVIDNSYLNNWKPLLNIEAHKESYRKIFEGLSKMLPEVDFVIRPRGPMEWLQKLAPRDCVLKEAKDSPNVVDLPNMIFISISLVSSALYEGLGRGIPCMVVRDFPVVDYTFVDHDVIPTGSVEFILSEIQRCLDPEYFHILKQKEIDWYKTQTRFSQVTLSSKIDDILFERPSLDVKAVKNRLVAALRHPLDGKKRRAYCLERKTFGDSYDEKPQFGSRFAYSLLINLRALVQHPYSSRQRKHFRRRYWRKLPKR